MDGNGSIFSLKSIKSLLSSFRKVVALYDCSADSEDELSFKKGDILQVVKEIDSDWLFCQKDDKKGIVPHLFVQKCA